MVRQRKDRFYNVLRTIGYTQEQKNFFIDYLRGINAEADLVGEGTSRGAKTALYIDPFGLPLAAGVVARESAMANAWSALGNISPVPTYVQATAGASDVYDSTGYAAPRISRKIVGAKAPARSKFTNKPYRKYTGDSASIPFGRASLTDTVESVYQTLATAVRAGNANARVTLIPERF